MKDAQTVWLENEVDRLKVLLAEARKLLLEVGETKGLVHRIGNALGDWSVVEWVPSSLNSTAVVEAQVDGVFMYIEKHRRKTHRDTPYEWTASYEKTVGNSVGGYCVTLEEAKEAAALAARGLFDLQRAA
jgi:hypothetical protein